MILLDVLRMCPACVGKGEIRDRWSAVPCKKCKGSGKIVDVMRAEVLYEKVRRGETILERLDPDKK